MFYFFFLIGRILNDSYFCLLVFLIKMNVMRLLKYCYFIEIVINWLVGNKEVSD